MTLVAAALHRPPGEVTKFFGCELGAQTTWTEETERAIVNGAHTTQLLQDKLGIYIEKFVLCPSCRLPETSYKIKNDIIYHQCVACGARESVDMQHKLTTYILKNHKLEKKARDKERGDKKDKKKGKGADKEKDDEDAEKKKKKKKDRSELTQAEKAERKRKKEKAERLAAATAGDEGGEPNGDEDDDHDTQGVVDDTGALESAVNGLRSFLRKEPEPDAMLSELRAVQTFCALPRNERAYILIAALFGDEETGVQNALSPDEKVFPILNALKNDSGPLAVVGGFEKLASHTHPSLQAKFPIVLKKLYDADVLDEQVILEWHAAGIDDVDRDLNIPDDVTDDMRATLLEATKPFIKWLQEAEEEGDDDDDEDGEDED